MKIVFSLYVYGPNLEMRFIAMWESLLRQWLLSVILNKSFGFKINLIKV